VELVQLAALCLRLLHGTLLLSELHVAVADLYATVAVLPALALLLDLISYDCLNNINAVLLAKLLLMFSQKQMLTRLPCLSFMRCQCRL
jgi:hypothetical protein